MEQIYNGKQGYLLWVTGLSGSGKSTIAKGVYKFLKPKYPNTVYLDGDRFRELMDNDLGYDQADRLKNAFRIVKTCNELVRQGICVICATISMFEEIYEFNEKNNDYLYKVLIHCDANNLIRRNQKGIYADALDGKRNDVVGINLDYNIHNDYDITINNCQDDDLDSKVQILAEHIQQKYYKEGNNL